MEKTIVRDKFIKDIMIFDLNLNNLVIGKYEGVLVVKVRDHYGDLKLIRPLKFYRFTIEGTTAIIKFKENNFSDLGVISQ